MCALVLCFPLPACNNFVGSVSSLVEDKEVKAEVRRRAAGRAKKRRRE